MASIVAALKLPSLPFAKRTAKGQKTTRTVPHAGESGKLLVRPEGEYRRSLGDVFRRFTQKTDNTGVTWQIPLIGKLPFSRQIEVLAIVIALLLLLTLATFGTSVWQTRVKREQALVANDIQLLSLRLANLTQQAAAGD